MAPHGRNSLSRPKGRFPRTAAALLFIIASAAVFTTSASAQIADAPWAPDLGDGRFRNPVLAADYSDPDVVRVGEDFYLTASSFTNIPGLPILHSRDLVNWTIVGHALPRLWPDAHHSVPRRGGGVWAPAIRHRDGKFWIYYADPDFGIFVVAARNPSGPWSAPILVDDSRGAIDPAPFWDDDGALWLVHAWARSRAGINNRIVLKRLSDDGTRVIGEARTIIDSDALPLAETSNGPMPWMTTEGPKLYKRNGWYYIFAPTGSVKGGWQGVFRSRSIEGPYEGRNVLDQGGTEVNGPHQGAWIATAQGEDWFLHFQDTDSYGRRVHLQPVRWRDDWPVIGADPDGDGRGEPVLTHAMPRVRGRHARTVPRTDDMFDGALSLAWQWNANPMGDWADLTARAGYLRLKSASTSANLWESGAILTQKLPGPRFTATTRVEFAPLRLGERTGLVMFGADYAWLGLENTLDGPRLVQAIRRGADANQPERLVAGPIVGAGRPIYLRLAAEPETVPEPPPSFSPYWPSMLRSTHARVHFSYSLDGRRYVPFGEPFLSRPGRWVGAQIGLFASAPAGTPSNVATSVGHADYDAFEVSR